MIKVKFKRRSRLMVSLIASAGFLALAVWGWDMPLSELLLFAALCIGFLLILVGAAALFGYLLSRRRARQLAREDADL